MTRFTLTASTESNDATGNIAAVFLSARVATREAAAAIAARFPKMCRVRNCELWGAPGTTGLVDVTISFRADNANKGANETGVRRIRRILSTIDAAADMTYIYDANIYRNSAPAATFAAFIGQAVRS
jgi:hypothetical protein